MTRFAVVCLFSVVGCVHAASTRITTATGAPGWFIECPDDQGACVEKATAQCPHGYVTEGEEEHRGTLTIRCR
jgi:hypothetical protein